MEVGNPFPKIVAGTRWACSLLLIGNGMWATWLLIFVFGIEPPTDDTFFIRSVIVDGACQSEFG